MTRPRVVVVGGGFAGLECANRLERRLKPAEAEVVLVSPSDYQLYLPLLPQVASGVLTPQAVAVSLRRMLRHTLLIPGMAVGVDTKAKVLVIRDITGKLGTEHYDYLVLAAGSITRTFDIPGLREHGRGMKTLAEATQLRDHVIAQLDIAAASTDPEERAARLQFVVVGGGYAGTETAACLQRLTTAAVKRYPRLDPSQVTWHLVDLAPKLMPELGDKLGAKALDVVRGRGIEVSLKTTITSVTETCVTLTGGRVLPCHTLVWTAGVAASPLVATLGTETIKGRLSVIENMAVPGLDGVFAVGDAAAVPDTAVGDGAICPPTAQHSMRQGRAVAGNVVAALRGQPLKPYRHKDLGLVVDLGGWRAVSKPLGIPLTGLPAVAVARGYHLMALRTLTARSRVAAGWMLHAVAGDDFVRTGFQDEKPASLSVMEHAGDYLTPDLIAQQVNARHSTRPPTL